MDPNETYDAGYHDGWDAAKAFYGIKDEEEES